MWKVVLDIFIKLCEKFSEKEKIKRFIDEYWPFGMIDLKNASIILYKELQKDPLIKKYFLDPVLKKLDYNEDKILSFLAQYYVEETPIYGKRMSYDIEKIKKEEFRHGLIVINENASLVFYGQDKPKYNELVIKKRELRVAINRIKANLRDLANQIEIHRRLNN